MVHSNNIAALFVHLVPQRNANKLRGEVVPMDVRTKTTDVNCVERSINFIKEVEWRRETLLQRKQERDGDHSALAAAEGTDLAPLDGVRCADNDMTPALKQRGAAAGDFNEDGRVDLVVTQNGAATKLCQNATGRAGLRLKLKGPPGNPQGVGAVIRLHAPQGGGQAYEVRAGSGYWSQDAAVVVVPVAGLGQRISVLWPGGKVVQVSLPAAGREFSVDYSGTVQVIH